MMRQALLIILTMALAPLSAWAQPNITSGVRFDTTAMAQETPLALRGVDTLIYLGFIKAYAGAFYLPVNTPSPMALSDTPKRLVLEYFRSIKAEDFAEATMAKAKENTTPEAFNRITDALIRLCRSYRDVSPKDRYALVYHPEHGLDLRLNGVTLGTFKGRELSRAMFAIWLGEYPISESFRDRLLGVDRP